MTGCGQVELDLLRSHRPGNHRRYRRMTQRKLQGSGGQWDAVPLADSLDTPGFVELVWRGLTIVVARARHRSGGQ